MATGIQTGMRTGSAPMPTGTRGGAPAGGGSPIQKMLQSLNSMSLKAKIIGGSIIGVLVCAVIAFAIISKNNEYVPLYETPLTETDVRQISEKLTQLNVPYSTTEGGKDILVAPSDRSRVRMQLAQYGLPLRKLTVPEQGGLTPQTPKQLEQMNLQLLQVELTESVRQIAGVADAFVKVVQPEQNLFASDTAPATATVMLKMQPGVELTPSQVKGVVHLVAFSVEGLDPKNVKVVDTNGMILSDIPSISGDSNDPSILTGQQNDKKVAYEKELEKKVQAMLDSTLGPNKAKVAVNATLDFSSKVKESKVVGGVGNTSGEVVVKSKTSTETYTSDPNSDNPDGAVQMSFKGGAGDANANYTKTDKVEIKDVNQTVIKVQTPAGTLERLSCSVIVDNLKPDQVAKIQGIVKDAIGIDETRGDSITVASMPFNREAMSDEFAEMRKAMAAGSPAATSTSSVSSEVMPIMAGAALLILLLIGVMYMVRQKSVQTEKSRLILSGGSNSTVSDISDLVSDKIGRSTLPAETKVNTSDTLEKLAKEKPTKVAELLKSTWLADKER